MYAWHIYSGYWSVILLNQNGQLWTFVQFHCAPSIRIPLPDPFQSSWLARVPLEVANLCKTAAPLLWNRDPNVPREPTMKRWKKVKNDPPHKHRLDETMSFRTKTLHVIQQTKQRMISWWSLNAELTDPCCTPSVDLNQCRLPLKLPTVNAQRAPLPSYVYP